MYFMYRLHLPHFDRGRPVAANAEKVASNSSSMASIYTHIMLILPQDPHPSNLHF